jgi:hypothetical protein
MDPVLAPLADVPVAPVAAPVEVAPDDGATTAAPIPPTAEIPPPFAYTEKPDAPVGERQYPSLYDGTGTTVLAVVLGIAIVGAIQALVFKMYSTAKSEHDYLTRFVTALVAIVVGCYVADLLIAGPSTELLAQEEKTVILSFIKDTAIMIFSYYFGLKAQTPKDGDA